MFQFILDNCQDRFSNFTFRYVGGLYFIDAFEFTQWCSLGYFRGIPNSICVEHVHPYAYRVYRERTWRCGALIGFTTSCFVTEISCFRFTLGRISRCPFMPLGAWGSSYFSVEKSSGKITQCVLALFYTKNPGGRALATAIPLHMFDSILNWQLSILGGMAS